MFSELVGVDEDGALRQWRWDREVPYHEAGEFHPRASFLSLTSEKVSDSSSVSVRHRSP